MNRRVTTFAALLLIWHGVASSTTTSEQVILDETTIRILLVTSPFTSPTDITNAIHHLETSWDFNDLDQGTNATSLTFANLGIPIIGPIDVFTGTVEQQQAKLQAYVEQVQVPNAFSLRDDYGADIVMGLSHSATNGCGWAPQENWVGLTGSFNPGAGGLDLDGRNNSYVGLAVVAQTPQKCNWWTLAHEFGHLLGGGHYSIPFSKALNFDSNATFFENTFFNLFSVSVLANVWGTDACPNAVSEFFCGHLARYSDGIWGTPNPDDHDNERAFRETMRSVANYRNGSGMDVAVAMCSDGHDNDGDALVDSSDPGCAQCGAEFCPSGPVVPLPGCTGSELPQDLQSMLLQVCIPGTTATEWRVTWRHSCAPQVNKYEVWYEQPLGNIPVYGWDRGWPWIDLGVTGASSRIRVRACGGSGCSGLSLSNTVIDDLC